MTEATATVTAATTVTATVKPGWKTSEFWLSTAAMVLGALYSSGVVGTSGTVATIAGAAVTVLGLLGYTVSRSGVKSAALKAAS